MLEYIERKKYTGEDISLATRKHAAASRAQIKLPDALDFSRRTQDDVPSAVLNIGDVLDHYAAKQMKQKNTVSSMNSQQNLKYSNSFNIFSSRKE